LDLRRDFWVLIELLWLFFFNSIHLLSSDFWANTLEREE